MNDLMKINDEVQNILHISCCVLCDQIQKKQLPKIYRFSSMQLPIELMSLMKVVPLM